MVLDNTGEDTWQEPSADIDGLLCLPIFAKTLLGMNTTLAEWSGLLPFPTNPAQ